MILQLHIIYAYLIYIHRTSKENASYRHDASFVRLHARINSNMVTDDVLLVSVLVTTHHLSARNLTTFGRVGVTYRVLQRA
jgi:hypothetical protein